MKKLILATTLLAFSPLSYAATVSGGDAANQAAADAVVDIVFAIDTSGSMSDEAAIISGSIDTAISTLACPDIDVWVNARLTGLRCTWNGTLFDERSETVLAGVGAATTINSSEDNGPVVLDFSTANTAYYSTIVGAGQGYAKAIVTIGDEGLEEGAPVTQADYDIGKTANDAAIANNIIVFSLLGNSPSPGASDVFQALAEGGMTLGGHTFADTGGSFTTTTAATPFVEVLQNVFCQAGTTPTPPTTPAKNIPVFGPFGLLAILSGLFLIGRRRK